MLHDPQSMTLGQGKGYRVENFFEGQSPDMDAAVARSQSNVASIQNKLRGLSQHASDLRAQREEIAPFAEDVSEMQPHLRDADLHLEKGSAIIERLEARPVSPHPQAMKRVLRQIQDANTQITLAFEALDRAERMRPYMGGAKP